MLNAAPIEVPLTPELMTALTVILSRADGPKVVIETGTYKGTGTTEAIIMAWNELQGFSGTRRTVPGEANYLHALDLYTIEGNSQFYHEAKRNLEPWLFVHPMHALSVRRDEAIAFMVNDPVIMGTTRPYEVLYDVEPSQQFSFYAREISPPWVPLHIEQDVLRKLIDRFNKDNRKILFVLDSAGGIGWLEFQIVMEKMADRPFFLWLDDRNHVKHFRSWRVIDRNEDSRWKVLFLNDRGVIAERF